MKLVTLRQGGLESRPWLRGKRNWEQSAAIHCHVGDIPGDGNGILLFRDMITMGIGEWLYYKVFVEVLHCCI